MDCDTSIKLPINKKYWIHTKSYPTIDFSFREIVIKYFVTVFFGNSKKKKKAVMLVDLNRDAFHSNMYNAASWQMTNLVV